MQQFPRFLRFAFFFSSLLRFESGGQSPARIFKRVEIFDLTGLRHWKYPIENAENKCRTLLSVRVGQKCRIILIQLDSRVNAKREIFRRVFFFFNLFSCANRHTIRSPITDSLRPCTIYIDIRPIFPLETTQWNTSYFDELHISFPSFAPFRDMILWKKIERSNLGRCQHLWKLLSPFFSAIQALKIS